MSRKLLAKFFIDNLYTDTYSQKMPMLSEKLQIELSFFKILVQIIAIGIKLYTNMLKNSVIIIKSGHEKNFRSIVMRIRAIGFKHIAVYS